MHEVRAVLVLCEHGLLGIFGFRLALLYRQLCNAVRSIRLGPYFLKHLVDFGLILGMLHVADALCSIVVLRHLLD